MELLLCFGGGLTPLKFGKLCSTQLIEIQLKSQYDY